MDVDILKNNLFSEIRYLSNLYMKSSIKVSLKNSLSKIDKENFFLDIQDILSNLFNYSDSDYNFRIKSLQSCELKYAKNISKGNSIKSAFNDLLNIRFIVDNYDINVPKDFRVVDMRNGKVNDDGYRGIHIYYQSDNYHYPIEIQLNTKEDRLFADWSHKYCYKKVDNSFILELRYKFDNFIIKSEKEFMLEVSKLC